MAVTANKTNCNNAEVALFNTAKPCIVPLLAIFALSNVSDA